MDKGLYRFVAATSGWFATTTGKGYGHSLPAGLQYFRLWWYHVQGSYGCNPEHDSPILL